MIISRTPVRVSFFGGGTDYPTWYEQEPGAVLSTSIDKYTYVSCRWLPPFFPFSSRIVYSQIELVNGPEEVEHPVVREGLKSLGIEHGVAIHHEGDLPARTGMGSSSSFAVGLLHVLHALKGQQTSKAQLAREAVHLEQVLCNENVGAQDQYAAAFGGFNRIDFRPGGEVQLQPVVASAHRLEEFRRHLLLIFTGFQRNATEIAAAQVAVTPLRREELRAMRAMVDRGQQLLCGAGPLNDFGILLDESWQIKRGLTDLISTPQIDLIYSTARLAGATGGKVLGAGGGGFVLLFAPPERHADVIDALSTLPGERLTQVPLQFERQGSHIIHYDPSEPSEYAALREQRAARGQYLNGNGQASDSRLAQTLTREAMVLSGR